MKLDRVPADDEGPVRDHFVVEELSSEDIAPLSERFLECAREMEGLPALNSLTAGAFLQEVRRRFAPKGGRSHAFRGDLTEGSGHGR